MKAWLEFQQQELVMKFLMGLNESYAQTRIGILMMDRLPSISKVFALVIQEERQWRIGFRSLLTSYPHLFSDLGSPMENAATTNLPWSNS